MYVGFVSYCCFVLVDTGRSYTSRASIGSDCTSSQPHQTEGRRGMTAILRPSETGLTTTTMMMNPMSVLYAFVTRGRDSRIIGAQPSFTTLARKQPVTSMLFLLIICPIVIAYSMGHIIKPVCVCQCVCVRVCL